MALGSRRLAALVLALVLALALAAGTTAPSRSAPAEPAARAGGNPFTTYRWGTYAGPLDFTWLPYQQASGRRRAILRYLIDQPKAKWFGHWMPDGVLARKVADYIAGTQQGDPDRLVQFTLFRMVPWEQDACRRLPTAAEQRSYRRWIGIFADAVGDTPAAIVLQPDGPFAQCAPGGSSVLSDLLAWTTRRLGALPRTSVYIEAGASDWPAPGQGGVERAADLLIAGGVADARGFALNGTHHASTADQVRRAAAIAAELARRGVPGKRAVVNTSGNGHPFDFGDYRGPDPLNAQVCRTPSDTRTCISLGIPPTADVGAARWGLPDDVARQARRVVDAYVWFGRPWLYRQNEPFVMSRALPLVTSSPFWPGLD